MHDAIKKVIHPFYSALHFVLHKTLEVNPLIRKNANHKKIIKGHIRIEQETNPELDKKIIKLLDENGIKNESYSIDAPAFKKYLSETIYPSYYYGGILTNDEFIEKALEHFVSLKLVTLNETSVAVDIGAANSPFYKIVKSKTRTPFAYSHDKIFKKGIHENKIGSLASRLPLEKESVDVITLHCSLEHFEGTQDKVFFREAERVLIKGGKCIVLPLYLSSEYTVHLDPVYNLLKWYHPNVSDDKDAVIRYCDSRQHFSRHYDVKNFKERILNHLHFLDVEIFHVENFKEINPNCYLRFIAVFTKK
jgi:hypothetical protein